MTSEEAIEADAIKRSGIPWPEWLAVDQCTRDHFRRQAIWAAKDAEISALKEAAQQTETLRMLDARALGIQATEIERLRADAERFRHILPKLHLESITVYGPERQCSNYILMLPGIGGARAPLNLIDADMTPPPPPCDVEAK